MNMPVTQQEIDLIAKHFPGRRCRSMVCNESILAISKGHTACSHVRVFNHNFRGDV